MKKGEESKKEQIVETTATYEQKLEQCNIDEKLKERLRDGLQYTGQGSVTMTDTTVYTLLQGGLLTRGYGVCVIQGPSGIGKTQLLASVAAHMSRGEDTPLGALAEQGKPLTSLIFATDGGGSDGWQRALIDRNANFDKISLISSFSSGMPRSLTDPIIPYYIDIIRPDIVIFDSLTSFAGGKITDRQDVDGLSMLNMYAIQYKCAIVVVNHYTKSGGWAGSQGIKDACREMYSMGDVYGQRDTVYLAPEKTSHLDRNAAKLRFFSRRSTSAGPELSEIPVPAEHAGKEEAKSAEYWTTFAERAKAQEGKQDGRKPADPEASAKAKARAIIIAALTTAAALGTAALPRAALIAAGEAAGIRSTTTIRTIGEVEADGIITGRTSETDTRSRVYSLAKAEEF